MGLRKYIIVIELDVFFFPRYLISDYTQNALSIHAKQKIFIFTDSRQVMNTLTLKSVLYTHILSVI